MSRRAKKESDDYFKYLEERRDFSEEIFEKMVVYVAGGGLVLTIGFVKDIVNLETVEFLNYLFATWILFAMTLLLNLISHRTAIKGIDCKLKARDPAVSNIRCKGRPRSAQL